MVRRYGDNPDYYCVGPITKPKTPQRLQDLYGLWPKRA